MVENGMKCGWRKVAEGGKLDDGDGWCAGWDVGGTNVDEMKSVKNHMR